MLGHTKTCDELAQKRVHVLKVDPAMKLMKEKRRKFTLERVEAIAEEVKKLLNV